jgi:PPOX class probable F420-dependent enzyme
LLPENVIEFVSENHQAVLTTFRRDGAAQMSIVTVGTYGDGAGFTTTEDRAKLHNLARNPRCSLLVSKSDWWGYVVLEGHARVLRRGESDETELRDALRGIYRSASGQEHPNWDEYDQAMIDDRRAAVIVVPERIYGTAP